MKCHNCISLGQKDVRGICFSLNASSRPFLKIARKKIKRNAVSLLSAPCHRKSELNMKTWKKSMPVFKINNEIQTLKK